MVDAEEINIRDKQQRFGGQSSAKLPKLEIPKCNGDYIKYLSLRQLFNRMIGEKNELDGCEKFAYLKGQLEGEPLTMITHLSIENESYQAAWEVQ